MSIQINVDPTGLTQAQREAVAGFILAFPGACAGSCHKEPASTATLAAIAAEPLKLQAESLADDPAYQLPPFGDVDPAVAFGGGAVPLVPGAPAAPSTAGALPFSTAPVVIPGTTSAATSTAPAPPAAPPANVAATAAPLTANRAEVDSAGLPWDTRIHASSKAKIADGSWRKKKQLDPALLACVEAELRALMGTAPAQPQANAMAAAAVGVVAAPGQYPAPVAPFAAAPSAGPAATTSTSGPASSAAAVPPPPSVPLAPGAAGATLAAPNAATIEPTREAFVALVGRAAAAIQGGKITQQQVTEICAAQGVPMLPLLANRLDLLPAIAEQIDALIVSRG